MKTIGICGMGDHIPAVIVGCMRQGKPGPDQFSAEQMNHFIHTAIEHGANYFDHADIYGGGQCEEIFGRAMKNDQSLRREDLILQSKCGICKGYYDSSKEHILESVDNSLKRLQTEYLDVLLLHRPDALIEPEEVATAFDELQKSGKVKHFGVSNYRPSQIELLKTCVEQELIINQMELSIVHSGMISSGVESNMRTEGGLDRDGEVLNYCRINGITIQAWSPFQVSLHGGSFVDDDRYPELNKELAELAEKYNTTKTNIAQAWILRHPANMQVIAGTTKEERLIQMIEASRIRLTRPEWYRMYRSAGNILP